MGHATTRCTSTQPKAFVTPHVTVDVFLASSDLDLACFVVTPQPTLAATNRAVATRKASRLSRDLDSDCTAVARPCKHRTALLYGLTIALSRHERTVGARRRCRMSPRACGAPQLTPHGRLERVVSRNSNYTVYDLAFDQQYQMIFFVGSIVIGPALHPPTSSAA